MDLSFQTMFLISIYTEINMSKSSYLFILAKYFTVIKGFGHIYITMANLKIYQEILIYVTTLESIFPVKVN